MTGLSFALRRSLNAARRSHEVALVRGRAVRRALERAEPLDGAIVMNAEMYLPPPGLRYVTFDDMTVAQAELDLPPWWHGASPADLRVWRRRQGEAFHHARICCVASAWAGESVVRDYGIAESAVRVTGIGSNLDAPVTAARDWSTPRFLFVGRDWVRKGGPETLSAFSRLREEHPHALLDVVGGHPPLGAPGVRGHGVLGPDEPGRRRLASLFASATCFVMPSHLEPFGIVYVEAGAAGVPSIATTRGGAATAVGPGGVLVEPGDGEQLLAAMRRLAHADVAEELGARAYRHAQGLTWPCVAARVLDALGLTAPREPSPVA